MNYIWETNRLDVYYFSLYIVDIVCANCVNYRDVQNSQRRLGIWNFSYIKHMRGGLLVFPPWVTAWERWVLWKGNSLLSNTWFQWIHSFMLMSHFVMFASVVFATQYDANITNLRTFKNSLMPTLIFGEVILLATRSDLNFMRLL